MSNQTCWVVGYHAIAALLKLNPERCIELCLVVNPNNQSQQAIVEDVTRLSINIKTLDKQALSKRCGHSQHQGVAMLARPRKEGNDKELISHLQTLKQSALVLVLDQVQDPHNFGACLRSADAAGADAVVVAKDNASPITPTVQKVASGAAETLPIFRVTNLARCLENMKRAGVWIIGTSDKAEQSIYQQDLSASLALVMGAEGKGLRPLTEKNCDSLVKLPMAGQVVSSLNVSVATGVCLYEVVRQRA